MEWEETSNVRRRREIRLLFFFQRNSTDITSQNSRHLKSGSSSNSGIRHSTTTFALRHWLKWGILSLSSFVVRRFFFFLVSSLKTTGRGSFLSARQNRLSSGEGKSRGRIASKHTGAYNPNSLGHVTFRLVTHILRTLLNPQHPADTVSKPTETWLVWTCRPTY